MEQGTINVIITALVGLFSSIVGGVIVLISAYYTYKRQAILLERQINSQMELKARELMFNVYQKKSEEFNKQINDLSLTLGQLSMAKYIPIVNEHEHNQALLAFLGTIKLAAELVLDKMPEIENDLVESNLYEKNKSRIEFIKTQFNLTLSNITPQKLEAKFDDISKVLTYLVDIQNNLVERKREELFIEYLPSKNIEKKKS